ncbi:ClpP/crotonase [Testicularia cyperi]|uniref:ClpP/crotonase n=1 Tax=Testicularia cyperi TaxID=1882483 RepID=A0A317XQV3_9BASI|nr:ClpP/crotonase [Testicularia cyperi]
MSVQFTTPPPVGPDAKPISLSFPDNCDGGRIAVITFNSPERLNAVNWADMLVFIEILRWIAVQPDILITVLTGTGRYFSAGANVKDPSRTPPKEVEQADRNTHHGRMLIERYFGSRMNTSNGTLARVLNTFPKVLVGAMNGPAVGISAAILGHCDLLYTFDDFFLFTPFTSLALVSEGLASVTFVRKMGLGRAQEALLEGRRMLAPELKEAGFITRIFPKPAPQPASGGDKHATPNILDPVLHHLRSKLLPPTANAFALLYTKNLIQRATYDNLGADAANQNELRGAELVFGSGEPAKQFERLASGGRHKI